MLANDTLLGKDVFNGVDIQFRILELKLEFDQLTDKHVETYHELLAARDQVDEETSDVDYPTAETLALLDASQEAYDKAVATLNEFLQDGNKELAELLKVQHHLINPTALDKTVFVHSDAAPRHVRSIYERRFTDLGKSGLLDFVEWERVAETYFSEDQKTKLGHDFYYVEEGLVPA